MKIKLYKEPYINILVYYGALLFNIFFGWILAKLNTQYLEVAAYGQFSFFITFVLLGRSFFDFGVFESIAIFDEIEKYFSIDLNLKLE